MNVNEETEREAKIFGRYLLGGKNPDGTTISLYCSAIKTRKLDALGKDAILLRFLLKNSWAIGSVDSALAFSNPSSAIRMKLLCMSAILETRPAYAGLFLPKNRSAFYNVYIFFVGCRAVSKMIFGKMILLFF